ncbi:guanine nucleotide-binding protein-like 1 isoform X1 [Polypterus senegalus]|uniref:guanine nucleotide-binding protein-like 1 isoform X1 n=1 Tax=Polypterus senegalus TaxID=55291 RepID=UPI001962840E|nr:guanine nucleotide-binding protein-like 1 isoform X1 [Polypterus senegalus]
MPRKRPFSAKQKKKQLQVNRERKRENTFTGLTDEVNLGQNSRSGGIEKPLDENMDTSDGESLSHMVRKVNQQPRPYQPGGRGYDPNRYRLHFFRESREELERRKKIAQERILQLVPESEMEMDINYIYKPGSVLDFPRRPAWDYHMSKEQVLEREEKSFQEYLNRIYCQYEPTQLSYFEHNLETWRQLWRVMEMSDILLLITDIRYPVLHFPPALYSFIRTDMKKSLILVLNKIDLAPPALVVAWKHYFHSIFPELQIVCFTSFPRAQSGDQNPEGVFRKRQKRRPSHWAAAVGSTQLLKACETIVAGKVNLSCWQEKIDKDAAASSHQDAWGSDEDNEEETISMEHFGDVSEELGMPCQDLYKEGVFTLGCVGFPNVGKSSLVNGLVGRKVVSTSRTPGHTKYFQTYFLTPSVRLCDCPGLIFPSLVNRHLQILAGIYPVSQIQEPYTSVGYLAERIPVQKILKLKHPKESEGSTDPHWSAWDICEAWAEKRGYKTAKAARNDVYRAANSLLRLATDGRLCLCMQPPEYGKCKADWERNPETAEIAALQAAVKQDDQPSSEGDEITSSEQEDQEDLDTDEENELTSKDAFKGGKFQCRNMFSLLTENDC